jgi:DNA-binding response OmpR family regulator
MSNLEGARGSGRGRQELAGKRVLVAEDAWHVARALKGVLEETGLAVIGPAASVAQAEDLLERDSPDLAVVDINLKSELSYSLIDKLHDRGVPVIVVTGYAYLSKPVAKPAVMLQKPFSGSALLAKVLELVTSRAPT